MKKPNHKTDQQSNQPFLSIAALFDDPLFVQYMVEKLADRRYDIGYSRESVPADWQALETSSIEAYVNGNVVVAGEGDPAIVPFVGCFLFTCTKKQGGVYKQSFINSLS